MEYLKWFKTSGKRDSAGFKLARKFAIPFLVDNIESPTKEPVFLEFVEYEKLGGSKVSHLHWRHGVFETDDLHKSYPDYNWDTLQMISWEEYNILFDSADPVSIKKLRRRIEDYLRKNPQAIVRVAKLLDI